MSRISSEEKNLCIEARVMRVVCGNNASIKFRYSILNGPSTKCKGRKGHFLETAYATDLPNHRILVKQINELELEI